MRWDALSRVGSGRRVSDHSKSRLMGSIHVCADADRKDMSVDSGRINRSLVGVEA